MQSEIRFIVAKFLFRSLKMKKVIVQGQHEPIISEALFYEVQDILDGRKRKIRQGTKIVTHDTLSLRGFLICPP
jgi:hypothetical protein